MSTLPLPSSAATWLSRAVDIEPVGLKPGGDVGELELQPATAATARPAARTSRIGPARRLDRAAPPPPGAPTTKTRPPPMVALLCRSTARGDAAAIVRP